MKPYLLCLALLPLLLTGCASSGYVGNYPGSYGPGYYGPGYADGPNVALGYYNGGSYHHGYHHYATNYHQAYAGNNYGSYHSSRNVRYASTGGSHISGNHGGAAARSVHVSSGHTH